MAGARRRAVAVKLFARGELKTKSALAEMEARLMWLETSTRLKTVG